MSALDHRTRIDPAAVLTDGTPVSARRGRSRDLDALRSLAGRCGVVCDELELARLLRSDPAERLILCATIAVDGVETLVGTGVIELGSIATMPSLILADPAYGRPLAEWIAQALLQRARAVA